jgi:hypothetical protein
MTKIAYWSSPAVQKIQQSPPTLIRSTPDIPASILATAGRDPAAPGRRFDAFRDLPVQGTDLDDLRAPTRLVGRLN